MILIDEMVSQNKNVKNVVYFFVGLIFIKILIKEYPKKPKKRLLTCPRYMRNIDVILFRYLSTLCKRVRQRKKEKRPYEQEAMGVHLKKSAVRNSNLSSCCDRYLLGYADGSRWPMDQRKSFKRRCY